MSIPFETKSNYRMDDLLQIMRILRGEGGCPWDREQTHVSIRSNLIEEAYEVVEAIDSDSAEMLKEELGDLLLQVVFHSQMSQEEGSFTFDGVTDGICKKLIERHPHIFGDVLAKTSDEVLDNWDEIKKKQKGQTTATETLKSVPKVFPALMRSAKVQKRAAKTGFDYPDVQMAMNDLKSELQELVWAIDQKDAAGCEEELGDLLFAAVNVSRFLHLDAEESLSKSCDKFIDRFEEVEQLAERRCVDMKRADLEELNELWKEAKKLQSAK